MSQLQIVSAIQRFSDIRKMLKRIKYYDHRGRNKRKFSSVYERQRVRKAERIELFKSDERFKIFFNWIFSLQERLNVSNKEFARLCNVTPQMIYMWYNYDRACGGHFPSEVTFNNLLRLEIVCQAQIIVKKHNVQIRNKSKNFKEVKMPSSRLRLKANVYY